MTRKLTPTQLDEIEAVAKEATPGEWEVIGGGEYVTPIGLLAGFDDCGVSPRDARYIATFDPPTALALVAEVRELRAKVERVRELHRRIPVYETCDEGGCENAHCFETAVGDYAHDDDLVGHVCYGCSELSDEEPIYWTCDTIKALGEEA